MSAHCVIGLGFGDEGKGLVTDFLCSKDPANTEVVRFSGGHQCAHRVVRGDVEHIFSNFGSGSIVGCPTHWSEHCTFEPVGFMRERSLLLGKGVTPIISVDPDCPVTTPYDIVANLTGPEREHGTTGVGFFRTKKRHLRAGLELAVADLIYGPSGATLEGKLREIQKYYEMPDDLVDTQPFLAACRGLGQHIRLSNYTVHERLVFEGSQGLGLDEKIGVFPHVTPSDVTPRNARKIAGHIDEVWLVTRAYQTRHGAGPMTNEDLPVRFNDGITESNGTNEFQGEFRTSMLDLDQLTRAKAEGIDAVVPYGTKVNLVMTCADQLEAFELTQSRVPRSFEDADRMVRFIGETLGISGDLYVNTSPLSSTIRQVSRS